MHQELISRLEAIRDPDRAPAMEAYLKDQFQCLGISSPRRREVMKGWMAEHKEQLSRDFRQVATALYTSPYREVHYCAVDLCVRYKRQLGAADIPWLESLLTTHSWWDTVDLLASHCVGEIFRDVAVRNETTDTWTASGNLWLQRSCIISQLKYREQTDADYLFALVEQFRESKEFFLQKANGWALRQYSRYAPDRVRAFVELYPDLPRVTMREATKYL